MDAISGVSAYLVLHANHDGRIRISLTAWIILWFAVDLTRKVWVNLAREVTGTRGHLYLFWPMAFRRTRHANEFLVVHPFPGIEQKKYTELWILKWVKSGAIGMVPCSSNIGFHKKKEPNTGYSLSQITHFTKKNSFILTMYYSLV